MHLTIKFIYFFAFITFCNQGISQLASQKIQQEYDNKATDDFKAVQNYMNQYFIENDDPSGEKKWKRKEWFLEPRLFPSGKFKNLASKTKSAFDDYKRNNPPSTLHSTHGNWSFLGPNSFTGNAGNGGMGRVNSIDIHPTNDLIIYLCSPNGGIWKTTTGGITWTNITSQLPALGFADLEIDYTNPNIIYALSGDGDPIPSPGTPHAQAEVASIGILKSIDGGSNWSTTNFTHSIGTPAPLVPIKLLMHPTNPLIQFIVSGDGIYKTTDGWISNSLVFTGFVYDIEFKPGNPAIMYMSRNNSIYKSIDSGENWVIISDVDFTLMGSATRVELAVTPDFPSLIYAIAGDWDNGSIAFYASYLDGLNDTWTVKDTSTNIIGSFASYCIGLFIDPLNYKSVFGGGQTFWHSNDEGATPSWTRIDENGLHADVHDVQYKNGVLYVACDGGFFKSTNNGTSFIDLSAGLHITEIYRISGTPSNGELYFVGSQDNGFYRRTAGTSFANVSGSDGMISIIDYANLNNVYAVNQYGGFTKSTNGGSSFTWLQEPGGKGAWIAPYILDPIDPNRLFMAKDSAYRSELGGAQGSWEKIGSPWPGKANVLAQGVNNRNTLYASANSSLYRSDNALTSSAGNVSWTPVFNGLPSLFITGIAVDPTNSMRIFLSVSGYEDGFKIYRSTSGGSASSWVNISGSLPNVPVNCIEFHNDGSGQDKLYIGTDIGVFYRDNILSDWIYFSNFMPSVIVNDLYINPITSTLTAGTYGRGLWRSDLKTACQESITFNSGLVQGGQIHYSYNTSIISQATLNGNLGTNIFYQAGNFIDLKENFYAPSTALFVAKIGPCPN